MEKVTLFRGLRISREKLADEQALAQAELDSYIADQAKVVAPEPLRIVEISFDHHEYYADDKLIASISHDDNHLTQRWVVMVNDKEVFRASTLMRCDRFICTHYKDGTLLVEAEVQGSRGAEGKNLQQLSPLPLRSRTPMLSSSTENQIMAHIFNECHDPSVAAGLTKAIDEFFAHSNPAVALRIAGAFSKKAVVTA